LRAPATPGTGPKDPASSWSRSTGPIRSGILDGLPELLDSEPDVEVVLIGELGTHGAAAPIASHPRGTAVRNVPLADLVALLGVSAVLLCDNPELVSDAPGFGTP